jgi:hypothetical protein
VHKGNEEKEEKKRLFVRRKRGEAFITLCLALSIRKKLKMRMLLIAS